MHLALTRGPTLQSIAAANPLNLSATPTVPLFNGDIPAAFFVGSIAAIIAPSIPPTLLIRAFAFSISALLPPLTTLAFLLLRITNTNLRATIRADAKLTVAERK
ncbi:hypothetical protein J4G37_30775 [Microvirga sp. 3-52]|nr:hypothetical protein [Microvirga sp. 3-52]